MKSSNFISDIPSKVKQIKYFKLLSKLWNHRDIYIPSYRHKDTRTYLYSQVWFGVVSLYYKHFTLLVQLIGSKPTV